MTLTMSSERFGIGIPVLQHERREARKREKEASAEFDSSSTSHMCTSQPPLPKRSTSPLAAKSAGTNDKYKP